MRRLWELLDTGPLLPALWVSGQLYLVTLAVNIVIGVTLGLVLARMKLAAAAFEPYIYILYATPTISLVPFISVLLGFDFGPRVLVSVLISIFPILIGVTEGARSIPRQHLDVAAIFGSNEAQLWRDVIVPYVMPFALSGIKQSIALSMAGTLVAEFFLNPDGIAAVLLQGTTIVDSGWVLAVTIFISAIAVALVGVGELLERYMVRWRRTSVG
jgi:NitT/TauT family transport system permease protein